MKVKDFIAYTVDKIVIYKRKEQNYNYEENENDEYDNAYAVLEYIDLYKGNPKKVPAKYLDLDIKLVAARRKGILDIWVK